MEWVPWEIGRRGLKNEAASSLREAFKTADTKFASVAEKENLDAGCTALSCLIRDDKITCANLGDCRAVVGQVTEGSVKPDVLTHDHNVKSSKEVESVIQRGGMILRNRVNGVLSVTRALGNKSCRDLLSQEPDVITRDIKWGVDEFIVIGSDGLYDRLSNEEVVEFIHNAKSKFDKKLHDLRQALAEHVSSQEQDDEAMAMLGLADSANSATTSTTIPLQLAEQFLQCSYQQIADSLVQHAVSTSTGYCDNTTCVILFFDADSLTSAELGESLRVVGYVLLLYYSLISHYENLITNSEDHDRIAKEMEGPDLEVSKDYPSQDEDEYVVYFNLNTICSLLLIIQKTTIQTAATIQWNSHQL